MRHLSFLFLLASVCQLSASASTFDNIKRYPNGAEIRLDDSLLRIEFTTQRIVHVRATKNESWSKEKSLMLAGSERPVCRIEAEQSGQTLKLSSSELVVVVSLETGAISYHCPDGKLLATEAESPRSFREVDVVKSLPVTDSIRKVQTVDGEREVAGRYEVKKDRRAWEAMVQFKLAADEALYGLGFDEQDDLNLRGKSKRLYQHNMRIVVPSLVSTKGYGLLFDAYCAMSFEDNERGMSMSFDVVDQLDYYFIYGPDMDGVVSGYRELTGRATLMPKWAYGYVQSKERYATQDDLLNTLSEFRRRQIPIDVIVQDWNYWKPNCWGSFVPEESRYPDLTAMCERVHEQNAHIMISIWPNPSDIDEPGREIRKAGYMLSGSSYVDFFNEAAGDMYFDYVWQYLGRHGIDSWWCDSTEPEVKDWGERERPTNADELNINGLANIIDPQLLNAYGLADSQMFYDNWRKQTKNKRLVNLTRSGFAGSQAVGAVVWTGDISANWSTLAQQVAAMLNFSASGNPYVTTDIGAFFVRKQGQWFRNGDYDRGSEDLGYRELYTRWLQFGSFLTMFRSHGTDTAREPWRFGEPGTPFYDSIVSAIDLRYRLMPHFYSLGAKLYHENSSFVRPVAFDYPSDINTHDLKTQMLVGESIMVCPVLKPMYYEAGSKPLDNASKTIEVYLPQGTWFDFLSEKQLAGGKTITVEAPISRIPIYVKSGNILPMGPKLQYADEKPSAPIELRVYPGADAEYLFYEDAGDGWGYENGEFSTAKFTWDDDERKLTIGARKGSFDGMLKEREINVVVVGEGKKATVNYKGQLVTAPCN
jgi:alpha-D-xyloside xylohydrolase